MLRVGQYPWKMNPRPGLHRGLLAGCESSLVPAPEDGDSLLLHSCDSSPTPDLFS